MGRSRNVRALTANVEKPLSDAVSHHCERLGKPVSQWLGSAAELNLAIDAGEMALFDVSTTELERRKQQAEDWAKIGVPGDLTDKCRRMLFEAVQRSDGYMVIPAVGFNQMLLGFYNIQEQWRSNANFWETRCKELAGELQAVFAEQLQEYSKQAQEIVAHALNNGYDIRSKEVETLRNVIARLVELNQQACSGWAACESELQAVRRKLAKCEEPENCQ